jgi:hypothetical protein
MTVAAIGGTTAGLGDGGQTPASEQDVAAPASPPRGFTVALGVAATALYGWTVAPSLVWADGARLQTEAITGQSIYLSFPEFDARAADGWPLDRLGVAAWDHPLWVAIGHGLTRLPVGDDAHLLNLLSGAAGVAAIVVFFRLMDMVIGSRAAALAGAATLAVSHTFWFHAVTAEAYTLHVLFMGALITIAVRYHERRQLRLLVWFALIGGLGTANHVMLAMTIVPLTVLLASDRRRAGSNDDGAGQARCTARGTSLVVAAFFVGVSPWLIQFARMSRLVGFSTTMQIAVGYPWLAGRFPGPVGVSTLANLVEYLLLLTYQFTPIGLALGVIGIFELRRRAPVVARWLIVLFVVHSGFSANYDVPDRFTFHITSYVVFSVFVGAGVARLIDRVRVSDRIDARRWRSALAASTALALVVAPITLYEVTPTALAAAGLDDELAIPDIGRGARDPLRYFFDPDKRGDDAPTEFGRSALESLPPGAVVLAPWPGDQETYIVLRHFQLVAGLRPDVHLDLALFATGSTVHDRVMMIIDEQAPCRPIFVASRDPAGYPWARIETRFDVVADGMLYRLRPRRDPLPGAACPPIPGPPLEPAELVERATHA